MPTRTTIACAALFCLEVACGGDDAPPPPDTAFFSPTWEHDLAEVRDCRRSVDHALRFIRVLADDAARPAYVGRDRPFPVGSLVLKAEYDDESCTSIAGFTAMRKEAAGSRPGAGDWSYQETDASRNVLSSDGAGCVSCHRACEAPDGYDRTCAEP